MSDTRRILHLEDNPADCELVPATLEAGGFRVASRTAATREEFLAGLAEPGLDLILADYKLPSFDGLAALALARERRPEVPFLFVSGFIGEEVALESLKHGATDYVFKHNLARLVPAARRALDESREQRERRQAEAALREREATLAAFFDAAPSMMGVIEVLEGDDLLVISTNAASARYIGREPRELVGRRVSTMGWPPELLRRWAGQCREALRLGRPVEMEHHFFHDGREGWFLSAINALPSGGGPPRCCFVTADITERKQLEQQFLRAQRLESVGILASGIAHDLNNVLAPVAMSLRVFRPKLADPEDLEVLASVEASVRRGADILRQVLAFARGEEGARQPVCVGRLVADLAKIVRDTFPRSIQVEVETAVALEKVLGDATQIYQVLMNLCLNARDAMPGGGRLALRVAMAAPGENTARLPLGAHPGPHVVVTVADSGGGIAPENLNKIFDPFFTTKGPSAGTGLGLSTALTIVKSHGGFITVASQPGHGAEFKVHLPAHREASPAPPPAAPPEIPRGSGELILVVDDEPAIRQSARAVLASHGYRVLTAADGAEALAVFDREAGDIRLVITDMMMPALDGAALIRALRERRAGLSIIAMSGLVEGESLAAQPGPGQVAFLQKPFTSERLLLCAAESLKRAPGAKSAS